MKKVFLDVLPRYQDGRYKGKINWKESIGCKVKFQYEDIEGEVEIMEYQFQKQHLFIKYKNKENFKIGVGNFVKCNFGGFLNICDNKRYTYDQIKEYIEVESNSGCKLLSKEYTNNRTKLDIECRCGNKFRTCFSTFKFNNKRQCNECSGYNDKLTKKQIIEIVKSKLGDEYTCIKVYKNKNDNCVVLKDTYGYMYNDVLISNIKKGKKPSKFHTCNPYTIQNIKLWCKMNKKSFTLISNIYNGKEEKLKWLCKKCNNYFERNWHEIFSNGYDCTQCSDGKSYGEKFMYCLLNQINIKYLLEYSPSWVNNKRYDIFLQELNTVIEIHGIQHYKQTGRKGARTLEEEQENDKFKKELSLQNGIKEKNYIVIDCRYSELDWIKNNIMKSKLPQLLNFNEEDINWLKCEEFTNNSLIKLACDLWNSGIKNTIVIGNTIGLNRATIIRYLKKGSKLTMCDYDPKKQMSINSTKNNIKKRKSVIQYLKDGKYINEFESISEASIKLEISTTSITNCCKGRTQSAGNYMWKYKIDINDNNITPYAKNFSHLQIKVVQMSNDGELINVWDSATIAGNKLNIIISNITRCCKRKVKTAGGYRWIYYDEYIKQFDKENLHKVSQL